MRAMIEIDMETIKSNAKTIRISKKAQTFESESKKLNKNLSKILIIVDARKNEKKNHEK